MTKWFVLLIFFPIYLGCGTSPSAPSVSTLANLAGTWKTKCQGPTSSVYAIDQVVVSGSNMTETFTGYTDAACANNSTTMVATFTLSAPGTTSDGVAKLNATVVTLTSTPNTAAAATNWNTASYCGFTNWANGVTKDITGNTTCQMKSAGSVNYQTFVISSSGGTNNIVNFAFYITIGSSIYDFYDAWTSTDGSQQNIYSATSYTKQ